MYVWPAKNRRQDNTLCPWPNANCDPSLNSVISSGEYIGEKLYFKCFKKAKEI